MNEFMGFPVVEIDMPEGNKLSSLRFGPQLLQRGIEKIIVSDEMLSAAGRYLADRALQEFQDVVTGTIEGEVVG